MDPNDERYRAMVESGSEALELLDAEGRLLYLSPAAEALLGFSSAERTGRSAFELIHPADLESTRVAFASLAAVPGARASLEFRARHRQGTWHHVEATGTNLLQNPAVGAIVVSVRDVTARKLTEEALRRLAYEMSSTGDALFQAVVRHLVEALGADYALIGELLPDGEQVRTMATHGEGPFQAGMLYRLRGTPCEDIMTRGLTSFPRDVRRLFPGDELLAGIGADSYIGSPLFDRGGRPVGIMAVVSRAPMPDVRPGEAMLTVFAARVTAELERLRDEQELRAGEARYRALLDEASDGIVVFGDDGRFQEANPGFCALVGRTRDEVLRLSAHDVIAPEDLARAPIDWALLRTGLPRRIERQFVRGDGTRLPVETKTKRLQDGRFLSIVRDISDRRQAEHALAELRERDEQLRQSQKLEAIGRLAGGVAHDFNNVLTAIMGYADLLLEDFQIDDPRRLDLAEIKRAAERAAGLTRQLLAFSRKQVLQPVELDPNAIVSGIDKLLRRLISDDVEFTFVAAPDLWRVVADPGQLEQVLINLVVNARDAMPEGGRLTIETRNQTVQAADAASPRPLPPGDYAVLGVSDTGQGIDPRSVPLIFEPFFTTKPRGQGTGLGLATVYGIVKQSEGFIFVDSAPGHGATFEVYLPRARRSVSAAQDEAAPSSSQPVVLLVEDESAVRTLAAGILRRSGLTVLEAADAATARTLAAGAARIDLLLTDIIMPGESGHELAEVLRQDWPGLKVVYMSGYSDERVRQAALKTGTPFVQKPFTPRALVQVVRETLTSVA
jgi:two-component system, cell cycle sensor histidine kinase and response regulator CckA